MLKASKNTKTSTPAPAGAHVARCVRIIDLGRQTTDGIYGLKTQPKVQITWELPTELHVFSAEKGEEPFVVSQEYTLSLDEKATLRHHLESWRGRAMTAQELEGFDVAALIGKTCTLNVIHGTSKRTGNAFAMLSSIAPMMKSAVCPPAILPLVVYDIANGRDKVFASLPPWTQAKIEACEEWKESAPASTAATDAAETAAEADETW